MTIRLEREWTLGPAWKFWRRQKCVDLPGARTGSSRPYARLNLGDLMLLKTSVEFLSNNCWEIYWKTSASIAHKVI
jgi:hypothetical protein